VAVFAIDPGAIAASLARAVIPGNEVFQADPQAREAA